MSLLHSAEEVPGLRCVSQRSATYSSKPRSRQLALAKHLLRVAGTWGTPAEAEHRETDKVVPGCRKRECDGGVGGGFPSQFLCSGSTHL